MATKLAKIVADFTTSLATKLAAGASTCSLQSITDDDGETLDNGTYFFTIDGDNAQKEHIVATLTGTSLSDIKSVSRKGVQTANAVREHRIGASVTITNFAHIMYMNDLLSGTTDLNAADPLAYDADPDLTGNNKKLATVKLVEDTAMAGGADASTSVKGISKLSVAPASATEPIAVGVNDPKVSPVSLATLTADTVAALPGTSGTPSATNKYVTNDDTAENAASKLVRRASDGGIAGVENTTLFTAGEALVEGNFLKLFNNAGAAELRKIKGMTCSNELNIAEYSYLQQIVEIADNKYMAVYYYDGGTNVRDVIAQVFSVSGTTISAGSPVTVFDAGTTVTHGMVIEKVDTDKAIIAYTTSSTAPLTTNIAVIATVSGTTITLGVPLTVSTHASNLGETVGYNSSSIKLLDTDKLLYVFHTSVAAGIQLNSVILSVSTATITAGSIVTLGSGVASIANLPFPSIAVLSTSLAFVTFIQNDGSSPHDLAAQTVNVSGTTITAGTYKLLRGDATYYYTNTVKLDANTVFIVYQADAAKTTLYYDVCTTDGTTITIVSQSTIATALADATKGLSLATVGNFVYIYSQGDFKVWKFFFSGSTVYLKGTYTLTFSDTDTSNILNKNLLVFDTANTRLAFFKSSLAGSTDGIIANFGLPDWDEFIGISDGTYTAAETLALAKITGGQTGLITSNQYGLTYGGALALGIGSYQLVGRAVSTTELFTEY